MAKAFVHKGPPRAVEPFTLLESSSEMPPCPKMAKRENEGLRIAESTWRIAEGSHFAFCSSVVSLKERIKLAHCQEVPQSCTISPNDPEHDDAKGWCKTAKSYTKG
ncbi:hypothetical protein H5410_045892 [Solanum commersonii]|uniref:Uncharacterized protein n=1 Tax=Solanum commersonii TaxID=4109 RepID=A0A9J5XCK3_SOLCO|nr:hypothetical protein H5410_045892 [Solanum commersonii]